MAQIAISSIGSVETLPGLNQNIFAHTTPMNWAIFIGEVTYSLHSGISF